jgi:fatty acid desaturase
MADIYHHWYPAIPFTRLPAVHRVFKEEGLVQTRNVFHGYVAYLKYLLTPAKKTAAQQMAWKGRREDVGCRCPQ